MKIRLLSGSCYVAILIAFYCLKIFVHDFCFDALIYAFALLGTGEMLRAMKEKITKPQRIFVMAYAVATIPLCAAGEYFLGNGLAVVCVCTLLLAVALLSLLVLDHDKTSVESLGVALLSAVYPTLLLSVLTLANHAICPPRLERYGFNSSLMMLFIFVVSPCADSIAYVFGCTMRKKFPKKMAPKLSPNKTVIGGIGGLVGGVLGAAVLYFVYGAAAGSYDNMHLVLPVYLGIGLIGAVATAFGDLVESCIKRKVGVKDMGKIMPGHGGVLDRIDGTLFITLVVYLVFQIVYLVL